MSVMSIRALFLFRSYLNHTLKMNISHFTFRSILRFVFAMYLPKIKLTVGRIFLSNRLLSVSHHDNLIS